VNDRTVKASSDYVWALQDVNFDVKQGEVLGIIGRNGAGKSTLLKILSKVTQPTKGNIKVKGRIASLLEVGTGFHPELSGRDNIFLNGAILGMSKQEIKSKFDEIVAFSGVERYIDTPVKRYSSGMYVRLAFAVAAHLEPEILIIDEVLAVGDAEFQKQCLGKMKDVSDKDGRTVLFVSHNLGMINQLCTRSILMQHGKLTASGDTKQITEMYLSDSLDPSIHNPEVNFKVDEAKYFQMLSVGLKNADNNKTNLFECDDPIVAEIKCIVRKPVSGLYGYFRISTIDKTTVLVSDTFDAGQNNVEELTEGTYTISITIPARHLAHGEYTLYVSFSKMHAQDVKHLVHEPSNELIAFRVDDHTTRRGNNRQGFFSSIIDWKVMKEIGHT
jgi:lipopolysaccharide transport system ATP-binding protein